MKLIENNQVILFNDVLVDTSTLKYKNIKGKKSDELLNLDASVSPSPYEDFYKEQHLAVVNNIPEIFYKEYPDTARELNIDIKDYLNKSSRLSNDQLFTEMVGDVRRNDRDSKERKPSKISTFFYNLKSKLTGENLRTLDQIISCFNNIKIELGKESIYVSRIQGLLQKLAKAQKSGQEALKEKIFEEMIVDKYESILYASGFTKVITEKQLLKIGEKIKNIKKRNLELTYIKNYVKQIPDNIVDLKLKSDLLEVFDNYVILHYGDKISESPTAKEQRKINEIKRDPILFGIIKGSRKLYYIGDWIDKDDDLTWKTIEENSNGENFEIPEEIKINL